MKKNLIFRLLQLILFSILFHSCIHDETLATSDPASHAKEYTNKSLWKEDEKYIKNVRKVFDTYADKNYFSAHSGEVYWDYALTMGTFDESFLEVPVVKNGKINYILVVNREKDRVYFKRKEDKDSKDFFNVLVFKDRNQLTGRIVEDPSASNVTQNKGQFCYMVEVRWSWTNADGSPGETFVYNHMRCQFIGPALPTDDIYPGGGGGGDSGGGGGFPYPQEPDTPCKRTQNMLSQANVQPKIKELKDQTTKKGEIGVMFKADGTPSDIIPGGDHSVNFGDKTGYAGGYHNHTPTGIPMLSPPDIDQLLSFARAQPTSNPLNVNDAFIGMVAPNGMHYVIWFNGTYQDAITNYSQDQIDGYFLDYIKTESDLTDFKKNGMIYMNGDGSINNLGVEKLFFETLKNMGLEGKVNLQRIENDGNVKIITLDSNNQPTPITC